MLRCVARGWPGGCLVDVREEELQQALQSFRDAVAMLCHETMGEVRRLPCIIDQVRESLDAIRSHSGRGNRRRPMPPAWIAGMDWLSELSKMVVGWSQPTPWGTRFSGAEDTTVNRLWWLAAEQPRPQDTPVLYEWGSALDTLRLEAQRLLDPVLFTVDAPCPVCGARYFQTPNGIGGYNFHDALQIRSESADCGACGTVWSKGEIIDLAALVNSEPTI